MNASTIKALPRRNLVDETALALAGYISKEFAAVNGDSWLPSERDLASRLGVSRPVVREASKRLELQGVIEIHHGKGAKIVNQFHRPLTQALELDLPDPLERLRHLSESRQLIEPESARLAALRATPEQIRQLREVHTGLRTETDLRRAVEFDLQFHQLIAVAAGNRINALVLLSLDHLSAESRLRTLSATGIEKAVEHHEAILTAIENGDADEAARQMLSHVEQAAEDLKEDES